MDHYIVSARKYRPSTFSTVIGQKPLTAALKHAVATDRLAHAYLFCGSRGVGKTSCARIFAKTINCTHRTPEGEACNECDSCRDFNNGSSLNIIELDAASHNSVDDIKGLIEQVLVPPTRGRYRVFIVDEVHMLSAAAFNAFLKTLEEPPEYVIFILATTEKHKIIPTILSRCQIYDFSRITIQDMVQHLAGVAANEGITAEPAALNIIARKADGAMRDALSIFDQVAASTMGQVTYQNTIDNLNMLDSSYYSRLVDAFLVGDVPAALLIYQEVRQKGFDSQFFINGLALYLRDLMVARQPQTLSLLDASDDIKEQMSTIAAKCSPKFIYDAMDLCNDADLNFRIATNKQFLIELTLVKLCQLAAASAPSPPRQMQPVSQSTQQPSQSPRHAQPQTPAPAAQPTPTQRTPYSNPQPPQPVYQPPQPVYRQPKAVHQSGGSMPSFSLSGKKPGTTTTTSDEAKEEPSHRRSSPYTDDQLIKLWLAYADANPTERILINTMRAAVPVKVADNSYSVEVDDAIQVNTLNESKADILAFIHNGLANDFMDFNISIRSGESSPITWTQREVLQHMVDKHPPLADLINDFSLSI